MRKTALILILAVIVIGYLFVQHRPNYVNSTSRIVRRTVTTEPRVQLIKHPRTAAGKIVNGAKMQAIRGVSYSAGYQQIAYPMGDVPEDRGACTDVVIRALRNAGFDLQQLIHEDMKRHFSLYPKNWGLLRPDPNIDHRRVPNQMVFFRRFGKTLSNSTEGDDLSSWKAGDVVCWRFGEGLTHTGIISDAKTRNGMPLVIHNLCGAAEEDCLNSWPIIGHFRYPVDN